MSKSAKSSSCTSKGPDTTTWKTLHLRPDFTLRQFRCWISFSKTETLSSIPKKRLNFSHNSTWSFKSWFSMLFPFLISNWPTRASSSKLGRLSNTLTSTTIILQFKTTTWKYSRIDTISPKKKEKSKSNSKNDQPKDNQRYTDLNLNLFLSKSRANWQISP